MADDLIERLRSLNPWQDHSWPETCRAAANSLAAKDAEIERLHVEIAALRLARTHSHGEIGVGDHVEKVTGYRWPGEVRGVFTTRSGQTRYVVECTVPEVEGALHIYNGGQITRTALDGKEAP